MRLNILKKMGQEVKNRRKERFNNPKYKHIKDIVMDHKCKMCGSNLFKVFYLMTSNSYGSYCANCGTYVKFLNAEERKLYNIK